MVTPGCVTFSQYDYYCFNLSLHTEFSVLMLWRARVQQYSLSCCVQMERLSVKEQTSCWVQPVNNSCLSYHRHCATCPLFPPGLGDSREKRTHPLASAPAPESCLLFPVFSRRTSSVLGSKVAGRVDTLFLECFWAISTAPCSYQESWRFFRVSQTRGLWVYVGRPQNGSCSCCLAFCLSSTLCTWPCPVSRSPNTSWCPRKRTIMFTTITTVPSRMERTWRSSSWVACLAVEPRWCESCWTLTRTYDAGRRLGSYPGSWASGHSGRNPAWRRSVWRPRVWLGRCWTRPWGRLSWRWWPSTGRRRPGCATRTHSHSSPPSTCPSSSPAPSSCWWSAMGEPLSTPSSRAEWPSRALTSRATATACRSGTWPWRTCTRSAWGWAPHAASPSTTSSCLCIPGSGWWRSSSSSTCPGTRLCFTTKTSLGKRFHFQGRTATWICYIYSFKFSSLHSISIT